MDSLFQSTIKIIPYTILFLVLKCQSSPTQIIIDSRPVFDIVDQSVPGRWTSGRPLGGISVPGRWTGGRPLGSPANGPVGDRWVEFQSPADEPVGDRWVKFQSQADGPVGIRWVVILRLLAKSQANCCSYFSSQI